MTTIAYRDGMIAADTGMTIGETRLGHMTKIAVSKHGRKLGGAAGSAGYCHAFLMAITEGQDFPAAVEDSQGTDRGLLIESDKPNDMHIFESGGVFIVRDVPYYALGSGRDIALGAMFQGATAEQAVRAALQHSAWTYGNVLTFAFKERR